MESNSTTHIPIHNDETQLKTLSDLRKERIAQRRERVQVKRGIQQQHSNEHQHQQEIGSSAKEDALNISKLTEYTNQMQITNAKLDFIKEKSLKQISDKIVQASRKEVLRRRKPPNEPSKLTEPSETEQPESEKEQSDNPYDLNTRLLKLQSKNLQLVNAKNERVHQLTEMIRQKDTEYTEEMKAEAAETYLLFLEMNKHYRDYQRVMKSELEDLELALMKDRNMLIRNTFGEWERMIEDLRVRERTYYETHSVRALDHIVKHDQCLSGEAEDDRRVKEALEHDLSVLKVKLQEMKATMQLNVEKLEYNHHVLKKREEENSQVLSLQKRKINRLNDQVSHMRLKLGKQKEQFEKEVRSMQEDYERVSANWKEFSGKARRFKENDQRKYEELKEMFQEDIEKGIRDLIKADQTVYESILNFEWKCPEEWKVFIISDHLSSSGETSQKGDKGLEVKKYNLFTEDEWNNVLADETSRELLDMVMNEVGSILIGESSLINESGANEKILRYETLLKSLRVKSVEDFNRFKSDLDQRAAEKGEDETIDSLQILLEYLQDNPPTLIATESASSNEGDNDNNNNNNNSDDYKKDMQIFWETVDKALGCDRIQMWPEILEVMKDVNKELEKRKRLQEELDSTERENNELHHVLTI